MDQTSTPLALAVGLSRDYLIHHRMCPKTLDADGQLVVALAPQAIVDGIHDIAYAYRLPVVTQDATEDDVLRLIERLTNHTERTVELARADAGDDETATDIRDLVNQAPVVRYVNLLVRDAYDAGASDIHLEGSRLGISVRFRIDGVLVPAPEPPSQLQHAIISRIKLLAELDIAERRRPQDGRIRVRMESRELDLRVSTVPTLHGESVVLRLLDRGGRPVALEDLGMNPRILESILALARRPHGLLLVTGPTGSGKTTTLYSALRTRTADAEKIITVEDPVEYQLAGITQVPVHRQAGVTFAAALRSILRQDPDVIMLGEMRDQETAEVAVQAAMTGHLVMSTLHTNDAVSAIPRMLDLGIPSYLAAATVEGILAQRLVRRVCANCRVNYTPTAESVAQLAGGDVVPGGEFVRGVGCSECRGTGFRGRVGVYELLLVNDAVKNAISRDASPGELRQIAIDDGLVPLRADGWRQVRAGVTTIEEVLRVIQS
jgi:general secretion pathway protein E